MLISYAHQEKQQTINTDQAHLKFANSEIATELSGTSERCYF